MGWFQNGKGVHQGCILSPCLFNVYAENILRPIEVAESLPLDRLLLETDAPYMAPVPLRGKRCDSSMIAHTAARLAEVRGMDVDALLDATRENANRLFSLNL